MDVEWDENLPYHALIENKRIFRHTEDGLSEDVPELLSAQATCDMQTISNQICELCADMRNDNAKLLEVVNSSIKNGGKSKPNKKPKKIGYRLNVSENEPLGIVYRYDNDEERTKILSQSVTGTVEIYNLRLKGWETEELFAIRFKKRVW